MFQQVWQRRLAILLAFVFTISCSACGSPLTQASGLILPTPSNPQTFNYPLNQSAYSVFGFLYEGLLNENGKTGELEPALAESWEVGDGGKKITFTLREGLQWSDGHPLTADDVIFSYQGVYLNDDIPTSFKDILRIGQSRSLPQVKKIDDRRVEFSVQEPFAPFIRYMSGIYILPAHQLKSAVESKSPQGEPQFLTLWGTDTNPQEIVGNGQYRMVSYTPNQRVIFERNPYFWRRDDQGNPQPYIDKVVFQIIENTDNQLLNFRSGYLDTLDVKPEAFQILKREEDRGKYTIYNAGPDSSTIFMSFNLNKGKDTQGKPFVNPIKSRWFNNKLFRQAIAYGINREVMKNNIYRGLGDLQHSPLPVFSPFYLSPEEGLKTYEYNPEKSQQLLEQAGFKCANGQPLDSARFVCGNSQLLDDQGNRVQFTLLASAGNKIREEMSAQIKQDLGKLGIQVDPWSLSFNTYVERLRDTRDWDAYLGGFTGGGVEPHGGYNIWSVNGTLHTFNQGKQPGESDIVGWQVADWEQEIDDLYIKASQELNEEKRKELYGQAQQIIAEQLPFIYMVNPLSFVAIRDRVEGINYSPIGGFLWNLYELRLTE